MGFVIILAVVAVIVAVGALQNGQAVTVTLLFWQFDAPLALIILAATAAGLVIGVLLGWARALQRWRHRPAVTTPESDVSGNPPARTRIPR